MLKTMRIRRVPAACAAFGLISLAKPALAGPFVDGVPDQVEFGETGLLLVQQNNVNYASQPTSPGCGIANASIDTRKIWVNLSQAALLSGKNIRIYFDVCNGQNWTDVLESGFGDDNAYVYAGTLYGAVCLWPNPGA